MKKALSIILAIAMLLGCSLSAFAAVNAEMCDYCGDGTVRQEGWRNYGKSVDGVGCGTHDDCETSVQPQINEYICDTCDKVAYWYTRDLVTCSVDGISYPENVVLHLP